MYAFPSVAFEQNVSRTRAMTIFGPGAQGMLNKTIYFLFSFYWRMKLELCLAGEHKTNNSYLACLFNNIFLNMVNWCIIKQVNGTFKYNNF